MERNSSYSTQFLSRLLICVIISHDIHYNCYIDNVYITSFRRIYNLYINDVLQFFDGFTICISTTYYNFSTYIQFLYQRRITNVLQSLYQRRITFFPTYLQSLYQQCITNVATFVSAQLWKRLSILTLSMLRLDDTHLVSGAGKQDEKLSTNRVVHWFAFVKAQRWGASLGKREMM